MNCDHPGCPLTGASGYCYDVPGGRLVVKCSDHWRVIRRKGLHLPPEKETMTPTEAIATVASDRSPPTSIGDMAAAIEAVRGGMSATKAAEKYHVGRSRLTFAVDQAGIDRPRAGSWRPKEDIPPMRVLVTQGDDGKIQTTPIEPAKPAKCGIESCTKDAEDYGFCYWHRPGRKSDDPHGVALEVVAPVATPEASLAEVATPPVATQGNQAVSLAPTDPYTVPARVEWDGDSVVIRVLDRSFTLAKVGEKEGRMSAMLGEWLPDEGEVMGLMIPCRDRAEAIAVVRALLQIRGISCPEVTE